MHIEIITNVDQCHRETKALKFSGIPLLDNYGKQHNAIVLHIVLA